MTERAAGLIVPLFSCASTRSWGIGEIPDLVPMAAWMRGAGLRTWQLLPLNEMAPGEQSPYSAISAMAIDPIFIHVPDMPEFQAIGGEAVLPAEDRRTLESLRRAPVVDHRTARRLKRVWLQASFERFLTVEWGRSTGRAADFHAYVTSQAWWLDDYSLFRALHVRAGGVEWSCWPADLRDRRSLDDARKELANEVLFHQYLQWIADTQWRSARRQSSDVRMFGDLPFMVDGDSADVWARPHQFRMDATIGAPPDAFSADGQDWGTPVYDWDVIAAGDFEWLRKRVRRCADLFDGFRVDHLVGFYRTYARPTDGSPPFFTPADEASQRALGEALLGIFKQSGAQIIAEDLGTVPDFVRESLGRHDVPGFKVFRWERHWHTEGQPFRDPAAYPAVSVALSGTHDTEPMIIWWEEAPDVDRDKASAVAHAEIARAPYPEVRDVLVELLYASGSNLTILPIQDVFGWRDRINDPSVVAESNWVYRLPWPVDRLDEFPEARERQSTLRAWAARHSRL
jgi:4-alpha-glucanotransferase